MIDNYGHKGVFAADARSASERQAEPVAGSFSLGKGRVVLRSETSVG